MTLRFQVAISQDHRKVEVGRNLQILPGSALLLAQSSINQNGLLRILSRWILTISKDEDTTTSPIKLFQCLTSLGEKNISLMLKRIFMYFNRCLFPLVLLLDTTEKSLAPSSVSPVIRAQGNVTQIYDSIQSLAHCTDLRSVQGRYHQLGGLHSFGF